MFLEIDGYTITKVKDKGYKLMDKRYAKSKHRKANSLTQERYIMCCTSLRHYISHVLVGVDHNTYQRELDIHVKNLVNICGEDIVNAALESMQGTVEFYKSCYPHTVMGTVMDLGFTGVNKDKVVRLIERTYN